MFHKKIQWINSAHWSSCKVGFFNGFVFQSEVDCSQKSPIVQFTSKLIGAKQQVHWAADDKKQRSEVQPFPHPSIGHDKSLGQFKPFPIISPLSQASSF